MSWKEKLAKRISDSISPGDLSTTWGQLRYAVATYLYGWSDK